MFRLLQINTSRDSATRLQADYLPNGVCSTDRENPDAAAGCVR